MNLPKEFDFKSRLNQLVDVYHAVEREDDYLVTCDSNSSWTFDKADIHTHFDKGDYYLVGEEKPTIVYAVIYTVGYSSGHKELIGIYSTEVKAKKMQQVDMKQNCRNEWNYSIKPIKIDKTVNEVYQEW